MSKYGYGRAGNAQLHKRWLAREKAQNCKKESVQPDINQTNAEQIFEEAETHEKQNPF